MFIDGKGISKKISEKLQNSFSILKKELGKNISLGVFVVGSDHVIESFVKIKKSFAKKIGVEFKVFRYNEQISESEFIESFLKEQEKVDGVIVQLPLPKNFNIEKILEKIDLRKDVDLLNPESIKKFKSGKMQHNHAGIFPPVAGAIWKIIQSENFDLKNKKTAIVGRGKLTGEPFSDLLKNNGFVENSDFFFIDLNTEKIERERLLKTADIVISGAGVPNLIKKTDIKEGVFLIDAGTSTTNKKLVGDISLDCAEQSKHFSKTPGGVGPITVAVLYENLFNLVKNK